MGRLYINRTIVPIDYDRSTEGFNRWALEIRNQLHLPDRSFNIQTIIPVTNNLIKYHLAPINKN